MENRVHRPGCVTVLIWIVLIIAGYNLIRFTQTVSQWEVLSDILPFSPLYLALSGFIWGVLGIVVAWGLWKGRNWSSAVLRIAVILYLLHYWLDRLLLANSYQRFTNLPFVFSVSILMTIWIFWMFSRNSVKEYFGAAYE